MTLSLASDQEEGGGSRRAWSRGGRRRRVAPHVAWRGRVSDRLWEAWRAPSIATCRVAHELAGVVLRRTLLRSYALLADAVRN